MIGQPVQAVSEILNANQPNHPRDSSVHRGGTRHQPRTMAQPTNAYRGYPADAAMDQADHAAIEQSRVEATPKGSSVRALLR